MSRLDRAWRHFLPGARIVPRIVTAVVAAMTLVLLVTSTVVYWRVEYALDRQLDRELASYSAGVRDAVAAGAPLPVRHDGEVAQVYDASGALVDSNDPSVRRLLPAVAEPGAEPVVVDLGGLLPVPDDEPYRASYAAQASPSGEVVVVAALSRHDRDEALRELLGQLLLAALGVLLAAAVVGWAAARAALGPVERYRAAAAAGDPETRLPVDTDRDDELTRLGHTLNALLDEIDASRRRERQFLADASHELRSPLAVLSAEIEWAGHRPRSPEELAEVLASAGEQVRRLGVLADELLRLEEVSAPSRDRWTTVRLDDLVASSVAGLPQDATRPLEVRASADEVSLDRGWVEIAVGNLVRNALVHGAGAIVVEATARDGRVIVQVTDEGGGVPEDLGAEAFERFTRADAARSTPGSGLGLAMVAAVARRHGGRAELVDGGVRMSWPLAGP